MPERPWVRPLWSAPRTGRRGRSQPPPRRRTTISPRPGSAAQQSVLNEASQTLQVLAAYTVAESQIESLVTAKGYADCVVFMGAESVSVVVAPPEGGLTATDAARIKDIVISETDYTAEQIKIMEAN